MSVIAEAIRAAQLTIREVRQSAKRPRFVEFNAPTPALEVRALKAAFLAAIQSRMEAWVTELTPNEHAQAEIELWDSLCETIADVDARVLQAAGRL